MPAMAQNHVLVLDANQRSALAVTRSLGQISGLTVSTGDSTIESLAGSSRFSSRYFQYPSPNREAQKFLQWLERTVKEQNITALFPTTEIVSQLILMHSDRFTSCVLPFAGYETVMKLADKGHLVDLATQLDVPVPDSRWFAGAGKLNIDRVTTYPVVVKPCLSRIWDGQGWIDTAVSVISDRSQLIRHLENTSYLHNYPFMLQAFVPGHGAGIFAIYDKGQPVAYFSHQRLREKPPKGGVSVLSKSMPVDPHLREISHRLLSQVNWHGVAMVEFRVTPEGAAYLMEVNTRFWGSLQLAIDAGVDFPKLLWQVSQGEPPGEITTYNVGNKLRWLLGDIDSLYLFLKDSSFSTLDKIKRVGAFLTPDIRYTRHEVNRLQDIKPAWSELKSYLKALGGG